MVYDDYVIRSLDRAEEIRTAILYCDLMPASVPPNVQTINDIDSKHDGTCLERLKYLSDTGAFGMCTSLLKKILSDENITKIFHFGRADVAHIKYYLKTDTKNILDTKIASKLARSYSDSHSLKTLIKEFINIDISKQFQSSDFGGELSPAQLKYCANDVMYLHKIHEELNKILERENRIDLYKDCLKFLKTRVNLDLALFKDDIWSH